MNERISLNLDSRREDSLPMEWPYLAVHLLRRSNIHIQPFADQSINLCYIFIQLYFLFFFSVLATCRNKNANARTSHCMQKGGLGAGK